ncbi:c-type cytochrome biogenesis protein CcmI [Parvularcula sp. IMCC14364]|uniref:c-type cytochrome biogenesis protein CcmI n=1 Tax=Parvularcula sp. IMCC14364 TaxID=3067902 RepID=UPI002740A03F|nr:c-type cytochrome biogenesis protein CcmI [Parvularcula sp. IMCC14364]
MLLFLVCALLTFCAVAMLVIPYLRRGQTEQAGTSEYNLTVYRDQLSELDRDVSRGVIAPEEREAAKLEIERRMLLEARAVQEEKAQTKNGPPILLFSFAGLMPILAGIVYFTNGSPDQPASPFAERIDLASAPSAADGMHSGMNDMIGSLRQRLAANPEDAEGWALLARSLINLNRYDEAIEAYREANRVVGGRDRQLAAEYAETLVVGNGGMVSQEARSIFEAFLSENENDPQAVYYLALAKAQQGNVPAAVADWERLISISPPDAPWLPVVRQQLAAVSDGDFGSVISRAQQTGSATVPPVQQPQPQRGPTAADIQAAQQMTSDQQSQMIEGMVAGLAARLAEDPEDLSGWKMLARSYGTLGRTEEARAAYEQVLRLSPDDADAKAALGR